MNRSLRSRDRGTVLPLVLVVVVVLGVVVLAVASYATGTLKYGQVTETRADRLSAAEGGMRDVLERLQDDGTLCTTGAGSGSGVVIPVPQKINTATVGVNCRKLGGTLADTTSWAVIITGEGGVPDKEGLTTQSGGGTTKLFGGPTFVQRLSLIDLKAPLEIRQGNLFYSDGACAPGGEFRQTGPSFDTNLTFDPTSKGIWCTNKTWNQLFGEPTVGSVPAVTNPAPNTTSYPGCTVWSPGVYTTAPNFTSNNYMLSGNYRFDITSPSTGMMEIKQGLVTAGKQGAAGDVQVIPNSPCDAARNADTGAGATFYMDGKSHFAVTTQGSLEILRRSQGANYVSIQALGSHTLNYITPIVSTASGNNKQMAIHGQIWAPRAMVEFGEVTNATAAQLLGGAVVAAIRADASASATGFVIQVQGGPDSDKVELTATATKNGTTVVNVIAQLRFAPPPSGTGVGVWQLAVNSWRVVEK